MSLSIALDSKEECDALLVLSTRAGEIPTAPLLTFLQRNGQQETMSAGEVWSAVCHLRAWAGEQGLTSSSRVAILSRNRLWVPVTYLALWSCGITLVPLNPAHTADAWGGVIGHSAAALLIYDDEFAGVACGSEIHCASRVNGAELLKASRKGARARSISYLQTPASARILLYTSGTTARPKAVDLTARALMRNAFLMAKNLELYSEVHYATLPLSHAHALGLGLLSSLLSQSHLVFSDGLDAKTWVGIVRDFHVTTTSVVPVQLLLLSRLKAPQPLASSLRRMVVSSAPVSEFVLREVERKYAIPVLQGWGLSEFANFATCMTPALHRRIGAGRRPHCIGSPLRGVQLRVVLPDGQPAPEHVEGELEVSGPCRMVGYMGDAEATQAVFHGQWLRTGDLGHYELIDDLAVFYFDGRLKELIVRGDEKCSPLQVEEYFVACFPDWEGRFAVTGYDHVTLGEDIGVAVEGNEASYDHKLIVAKIATIPPHLRPRVVLAKGGPLPRTATGKVQRRLLRERFANYRAYSGAAPIVECSA
jgi:oxalate---CoA ligase